MRWLRRCENYQVRTWVSTRYREDPDWQLLVPRLDQTQVNSAWDSLLALRQETLDAATSGLVAPAPRLEQSQMNRAADDLISTLKNSRQGDVGSWTNVLAALSHPG